MKRILFFILSAMFVIASCSEKKSLPKGKGEKKGVQTTDTTMLRVAVMPTIDCLPLFVAREYGLYASEGVSVKLIPFQAQMDQDTAVERSRVDGAMTDLVRAEYMQRKHHLPLHYATATDASWQMVTNKMARITQKRHLTDKMIAVSRFSATDLLADIVIAEAALDSNSVFKIQVNDVAVRLGMLQNKIMDALLLPEPQATVARMAGAPVLFDARDGDIRLGVLAFRRDAVQSVWRQHQVSSLMKAYDRACDSINTHGVKKYRELIVRHCHVSPNVIDSLPKTLEFRHAEPPRPEDVQRAKAWLDTQP